MDTKLILAIAAAVLIACDAADTYMIIHHGKGHEANFLGMKQMIQKMGVIPALLFTHVAMLVAIILEYPALKLWFFQFVCVMYGAALVNNLRVWRK